MDYSINYTTNGHDCSLRVYAYHLAITLSTLFEMAIAGINIENVTIKRL